LTKSITPIYGLPLNHHLLCYFHLFIFGIEDVKNYKVLSNDKDYEPQFFFLLLISTDIHKDFFLHCKLLFTNSCFNIHSVIQTYDSDSKIDFLTTTISFAYSCV